ncbi:hypothetical protein [Amycolatopsis sp. TNS106]|uniref:hypothetical protein n=1 Tax=Amycolatopsis sp. TNS106 TaxID=2861750 RepID=UPI001C57622E
MPSCLALITNMLTDARERALAIGLWATTFALGMAAGPLVGGTGRVDLLSVALSLGASLPLVYAIRHADTHGFDTHTTATLVASAA